MNLNSRDEFSNINVPSEVLQDTNCVICFESFTKETSINFKCSHQICIICYEKLINHHNIIHCPLCREIVEIIQTEPLDIQTEITVHNITESSYNIRNWCSLHGSQLICYLLIFGGISTIFIKYQ